MNKHLILFFSVFLKSIWEHKGKKWNNFAEKKNVSNDRLTGKEKDERAESKGI